MSSKRDHLLFFWRRRTGNRPPQIRVDPRTLAYFGAMLALVSLAGWLYVRQASEVASYARDLRQLEQRKERLRREIIARRAVAAMAGSLDRVLSDGRQWGYDLPGADDDERRLTLEYEPLELPRDEPEPTAGALSTTADMGEEKGLPEQLLEQLEGWLASPLGDSRDVQP